MLRVLLFFAALGWLFIGWDWFLILGFDLLLVVLVDLLQKRGNKK